MHILESTLACKSARTMTDSETMFKMSTASFHTSWQTTTPLTNRCCDHRMTRLDHSWHAADASAHPGRWYTFACSVLHCNLPDLNPTNLAAKGLVKWSLEFLFSTSRRYRSSLVSLLAWVKYCAPFFSSILTSNLVLAHRGHMTVEYSARALSVWQNDESAVALPDSVWGQLRRQRCWLFSRFAVDRCQCND